MEVTIMAVATWQARGLVHDIVCFDKLRTVLKF